MHNYSADSIWELSNTGSRWQKCWNSLTGRELQNPDIIFPEGKEMAPALQR